MGGKKCLGMPALLVDILHDSPCYTDTIVGAGAASEFIEKNKAPLAEVVQYTCRLIHLYHKRTLAHRDIVARANTGENLVYYTDRCTLGGNETANLSHQHDQCRLAQERGFTSHIRTRDDDDLLPVVVEKDIIRYILFAGRQLLFNHRMPPLADINHQTIVHIGADILVFCCSRGKTEQTVELRHHIGIGLHLRHKPAQCQHQFLIEAVLDNLYFLFGRENGLFVLLEFFGNIPLGIDECLLADPLLRHLVFVGIAHLQVIAEDIVVPDLQALYSRLLRLTLLDA